MATAESKAARLRANPLLYLSIAACRFSAAGALALLAACGGGGEDDPPPNDPIPVPSCSVIPRPAICL